MKKRSIIFYWLLILIPAIAICIAAFKLLEHEQERIGQAALASVTDRAEAIAETLQVTVESVEDELQNAMRNIPKQNLESMLLEWERNNPLVRNVFIWDEQAGLQYPVQGMASTSEERRFMARFDGLFSGRVSWPKKKKDDSSGTLVAMAPQSVGFNEPQHVQEEQTGSTMVNDVRKLKSSRQELLTLAKEPNAAPSLVAGSIVAEALNRGGWMPWFVENRLYILGWVQNRENGPVYGVELELMTLLSRLITGFPETAKDGIVYALMDDEGRILHQAGTAQITKETTPDLTLSLAPQLPHWQLVVYDMDKSAIAKSGRGFILLAGLLLAIFITAIVLGGALLTWQVHRNMKDARQKTSFVSSVSHELKTPLTSIRMYAELLSEGRVKDPDKQKNYLQVIVSESQRLTRLVNNVLDFSRLEQGGKKYHLEKINLTENIQDIIKSHSLRIKEAGMTLKTEIPGKDIIVQADRDAIEQVILNLIDNAIKYASEGGELGISLSSDEKTCEINVTDMGQGVPDAHQERIFEKFHRVDDSLTAKQQGSGLGLSIARRILRDMGGNLIYTPGKNGGSCFVATIPLDSENIVDEKR